MWDFHCIVCALVVVTGEGSRGRNVRLMGHKLSLVLLMFCYELSSRHTHITYITHKVLIKLIFTEKHPFQLCTEE